MTIPRTLDFAQFLLDRSLLDATAAARVRARAASERTPIGQLLMLSGAMTVRQVMHVLSLQADHPGRRFGELAVGEGFIDTATLEAALLRQGEQRRHQIAVVHLENLLSPHDLEANVVAYVMLLELLRDAA